MKKYCKQISSIIGFILILPIGLKAQSYYNFTEIEENGKANLIDEQAGIKYRLAKEIDAIDIKCAA